MTTTRTALMLAMLMGLAAAGCGRERERSQAIGPVTVEQPWVRAMAPNAPAAGGFVVLRNAGDAADRLVAATSPDAERVEIHTLETEHGVMRMRHRVDGLPLPAGQTVELAPGGDHLMLVAPRRRFAEGEQVTIDLTFERAGTGQIAFPVRPIAATAATDAHQH